ncbi:MAG: hypothetical protein WCP39_01670 [Chlamydiota bacterium]
MTVLTEYTSFVTEFANNNFQSNDSFFRRQPEDLFQISVLNPIGSKIPVPLFERFSVISRVQSEPYFSLFQMQPDIFLGFPISYNEQLDLERVSVFPSLDHTSSFLSPAFTRVGENIFDISEIKRIQSCPPVFAPKS